jgi:hypothetical protein
LYKSYDCATIIQNTTLSARSIYLQKGLLSIISPAW